MTHVFNNPAAFDDEALAGFTRLNADLVRAVPGGAVRSEPGPPGKVAVLYGGGSGHYPAFAGLIGPGLGDGAVVGNIFTSPSAHRAYSVAKAAERGGGVVFAYGNYAGDVMNFALAGEQLISEGIDTRQLIVTDDAWSAPPAEADRRRGIAGDVVIFKMMGAAAEAGLDLDGVERVGRKANKQTRTVGVAFDGCTMPGSDTPLFTVPAGSMSLGLGIHGEPGLQTVPLEPSAAIARRLVDAVLAEAPHPGGRVAVLLNGLGATKHEELFVLWNDVATLFDDAGCTLVEPEVGELVTSLDMAGLSLTVTWLDDELETLWRAPAWSPAWRKGAAPPAAAGAVTRDAAQTRPTAATGVAPATGAPAAHDLAATAVTPGSPASVRCAAHLVTAIGSALAAVRDAEDDLARLDAVAGDGDHGRGMVRGVEAALAAAEQARTAGAGAGTVLAQAGDAWAAQAGGTSGVLWGSALRAAGQSIGDQDDVDTAALATAAQQFAATLTRLGRADLGDKTMVDAVTPTVDALTRAANSGATTAGAWAQACTVAHDAAQATRDLVPRRGRARPHAQRALGTPDPGAVSFALVLAAAAPPAQTPPPAAAPKEAIA